MTLHTRVAILNTEARTVTAQEAFDVMRELIGARADYRFTIGNNGSIDAEPGQGYGAWVWVDYDCGRLMPVERVDGDDPSSEIYTPAAHVLVHFDTSCGADTLGGAGGLHARFIAELYRRLAGASVLWYDEFSGTWHDSPEDLLSFLEGWSGASSWFDTMVRPLIESGAILRATAPEKGPENR